MVLEMSPFPPFVHTKAVYRYIRAYAKSLLLGRDTLGLLIKSDSLVLLLERDAPDLLVG